MSVEAPIRPEVDIAEQLGQLTAPEADPVQRVADHYVADSEPTTRPTAPAVEASTSEPAEATGSTGLSRFTPGALATRAIVKAQTAHGERAARKVAERVAAGATGAEAEHGRLRRGVESVLTSNYTKPVALLGAVAVVAGRTYLEAKGISTSHGTGNGQHAMELAAHTTKVPDPSTHPVVHGPQGYVEASGNGKVAVTDAKGNKLVSDVTSDASGNPKLTDKQVEALQKKNVAVGAGDYKTGQSATKVTPESTKGKHVHRTWHSGSNEQHLDIRKVHTQRDGDRVEVIFNTGGKSKGYKNPSDLKLGLHVTDGKHHTADFQFVQDPTNSKIQTITFDPKTKMGKMMMHETFKWAEVTTNTTTDKKGVTHLNELATEIGNGRGDMGTKATEATAAIPGRPSVDVAAVRPATTGNNEVAQVRLAQGTVKMHMPKGYNLSVDDTSGSVTLTHIENGKPITLGSYDVQTLTDAKLSHGQLPKEVTDQINTDLKTQGYQLSFDKDTDTYGLKKLPKTTVTPPPTNGSASPKPSATPTTTGSPKASPSPSATATSPTVSPSSRRSPVALGDLRAHEIATAGGPAPVAEAGLAAGGLTLAAKKAKSTKKNRSRRGPANR